jgi:hypothetical protein
MIDQILLLSSTKIFHEIKSYVIILHNIMEDPMKKFIVIIVFFPVLLLPLFGDDIFDEMRKKAVVHIEKLSVLPLSAHVETSPFHPVPDLFDKVMFTWDEDAPYLFINEVQLTIGPYNLEIDDIRDNVTNESISTTYSWDMEFLVVDSEVNPADRYALDYTIHAYNALYNTPAFQFISPEDYNQAATLENKKNTVRGFTGGIGMGFGIIAVSCLITAMIVDDYQGMLLGVGLGSAAVGGGAVFALNKLNDSINQSLWEIYERMADAVNAGN